MTNYLLFFGAQAMNHVPDEDMPAASESGHAVCQEASNAGVYVLAGGHEEHKRSVIVATDGTVTDGHFRTRSVESPSWTCLRARRRWNGPPRSPSPAAVR